MGKFIIYSREYRKDYQRFMKHLWTVGYSIASCKTFDTGIREFLWWLEKGKITGLDQVKEKHIENFYSYQQERPSAKGGTLGESRIATHMYTLKIFFRYLQETDQLQENPMGDLSYDHSFKNKREHLISQKDIQRLYETSRTAKQRALLGIIYGCGLRRQEAVKLNARDVHFKNGMLYVRYGKGGRKRAIPLSKTVLEDLKDYYYNQRTSELNRSNPDSVESFMLNNRGARMREWVYEREVKKLVTAAGLKAKISLHHFRHAIATHLLESGMRTEHVKDFLGHVSIETTQTYTHITTTQMKKTTAYGTEAIPG